MTEAISQQQSLNVGNIASSDSGANQQNRKSHGIPLEHLDFKYVEKCENVKELEKIFRVLESGVEGRYTELEHFVFEKIGKLAPNSRVLRKDIPISSKYAIPKEQRNQLDSEVEDFLKKMNELENIPRIFKDSNSKNSFTESGPVDEALPPVRSKTQLTLNKSSENKTVTTVNKQTNGNNGNIIISSSKSSNKSAKPRDYREWEKIEKELEKEIEEKENEVKVNGTSNGHKNTGGSGFDKTSITTNSYSAKLAKELKNLKKEVNAEELSDEARLLRADQEKCKGNEAFNAGSYEEALVYYTRSIQYLPNAASFNNRALAYLKLEKWDKVIEDCNNVFNYEKENIKALLRRGTAYFKKKNYQEALHDAEVCLKYEPTNNKAIELKSSIEKVMNKDKEEKEKVKVSGGKRLQIEETDGSSSSSSDEEEVATSSKPAKEKTNAINETKQTKSIPIAEVESDDDDQYEEYNENSNNNNSKNKTEEISKKEETSKLNYELPNSIVDLKDKGLKLYASGQYGDAVNVYTDCINKLYEIKSTQCSAGLIEFYWKTLIVLHNNRASCLQHVCDYRACLNDCDSGLNMIDQLSNSQLDESVSGTKLKLLWKKAHAYEMLEKYADSFKVYEQLMNLDSSFKNVQQSYNRIKGILSERGELKRLRESSSSGSTTKSIDFSNNKEKEEKEKVDEIKKPEIFAQTYDELKLKGNDFVKQNNFASACESYTKCIEMDPSNPLGYLNRSLCFIKLNQPTNAINDCSFVLNKDKSNVKALFRRAQANKMLAKYELVVEDLQILLKIEPNNQIAKREFELTIDLIKKQKDEQQKQTTAADATPSSTKAKETEKKIVEVTTTNDHQTKEIKTSTKQQKSEAKKVTPPLNLIEPVKIERKPIDYSRIVNAYEFLQAWNSIPPKDLAMYSQLLANVDPANIPKFIGSKLDDATLSTLIKSIHQLKFDAECSQYLKTHNYKIVDYLKHLTNTSRFNVIKLFMNAELKQMLNDLLNDGNETSDDQQLKSLRKAYDL